MAGRWFCAIWSGKSRRRFTEFRDGGIVSEGQKTAVVFGLANKRSIAWAIAQKMHAAGWQLAITYQNERLQQEAKDLIAELPGAEGFMCDVSHDEQIAALFEKLKARYGVLHG